MSMYENYEAVRNKKGFRDSDVCKGTGISSATMSEWKKGRYTPKLDKLKRIADFLGVSVDYIQTGTVSEQYYINPDTAKIAQWIFDNRDMRLLFESARGNSPENLRLAAELLGRMKKTNEP